MILYRLKKKDLSITPVEAERIGKSVAYMNYGIPMKELHDWKYARWFDTEIEAAQYAIELLEEKIAEISKLQEKIDSLKEKYNL